MADERIGPFQVLGRLGAGGMGEVLLAEDTRLGRKVALKVVRPELLAQPEARERFLQEARAASALDHPNICAIHGIEATADGRMAIVMAHYSGATLDRLLDTRAFTVEEALGLAAQVADGLAAAHAAGIIHRDIKPANVLVTDDGRVKILDFGIARVADSSLTATGLTLGTPAYMSPEQVRGERVDGRADLWSLGVMLYVLLTQQHPFPAESAHGLVYAALESEPRPFAEVAPGIPAEVESVLLRCLAKSRDARWPDAPALAHALRALLRQLHPEDLATAPALARLALEQGSLPLRPAAASALRADSSARTVGLGGGPTATSTSHGTRRWAPIASVAAVALVAAGAAGWWWSQARARAPLRIAVLPAVVEGAADSSAARLTVAATEAALLRALVPLAGVRLVDPGETRAGALDTRQAVRALAADELVEPRLVGRGGEWFVTLRRVSGRDGALLGVRSFAAPSEPALQFANALGIEVANTWPGRVTRGTARELQVSREDYDEFIALYRLDRDRVTGTSAADVDRRIDLLAGRAPRFLDAQLLSAARGNRAFRVTRDSSRLQAMEQALDRARRIAPDDPRVLIQAFAAALLRSDLPEARRRLESLNSRLPGDADALRAAADLAEREGRTDEALRLIGQALERRESRSLLETTADMELRLGRAAQARTRLDTLIARFPDDRFPRSKLAQLELMSGDPARADTLYSWLLTGQSGNVALLTNRGLARMLRADHAGAEADFAASLDLAPGNLDIALNRADCLQLLGRADEARAWYGRIEAGSRTAADADDAFVRLRLAQCLVHTGRAAEALALARQALAQAPDDAEAHFAAALVAAVGASPDTALARARRARELGVGASWFALPWFDSVRSRPGFPSPR